MQSPRSSTAAGGNLFGLHIVQDELIEMLRRAETRFDAGREAAPPALCRAAVVASDETGVRIDGDPSARDAARSDFLNCPVVF